MTDPFRLRVLKALTNTIKTVTPANGYTNNLADWTEAGVTLSRVFRGRELFGDTDPLPMVSVLEHPRALDAMLAPESQPEAIGEWDLLVQGFVEDDPDHPTDPAHILAAEVISAIAKSAKQRHDILGLGYQMPAVTKLSIGSPVVRPADGVNSSQAFFWLTLTLTLVENRETPFA